MNKYTRSYPHTRTSKEESWFSAISAGIFCVVIIALMGAILLLSTKGA
jgi:hypothetical protein